MTKSMTLSRHQIEQVATWLALSQNIKAVQFAEESSSGIGINVTALFYDDKYATRHVMDITDVSTW